MSVSVTVERAWLGSFAFFLLLLSDLPAPIRPLRNSPRTSASTFRARVSAPRAGGSSPPRIARSGSPLRAWGAPQGAEDPFRDEPRVLYEDTDLAVVLKPAGWSFKKRA